MKKNKHHQQQVRIIGGSHRRSIVHFDDAEGLRPTPDRVREQVFNWLGQRLVGMRVLDLFGGSGVMGLEAASRGAVHVDIVELNAHTARTIQHNISQLKVDGCHVHRQEALRFLQAASTGIYDVVVLDPPYRWQDWVQLWPVLQGLCGEDTLVYVEAAVLPELPVWLTWFKQDTAGQSHYGVASVQAVDL